MCIFLFLGLTAKLFSQNPHGAEFKIDCASCHSPAGWKMDALVWKNFEPVQAQVSNRTITQRFDHENTGFKLKGQHALVDCKLCHESLIFSTVPSECISCHNDIHQQTLGTDCSRCHSTSNWLLNNITALHQENGFPLFGVHAVVDCDNCHISESKLRFDRIGNQCLDCHLGLYMATSAPDHKAAGYSTNCVDCHDAASADWHWSAGAANHLFFPLTKGHHIDDCTQCHVGGSFLNTPKDCFSCHESNYKATTNPDHDASNFPTDCIVCHGTDPGWPANNYTQHDQAYFPIFSGRHEGEWDQCTECHTTAGDFKTFTCVECHEHNNAGKLANKHDEVSGYSFSGTSCYSCHPKGN